MFLKPTRPQGAHSRNRLLGLLDPVRPKQEIRRDLVERVRRQIAEGVYETPEKWQGALDRLARDLE